MTNEEMKKKICDIIAPYVSAYGDDERIADALILEGIGYVWDITEKAEKAIASLIKQNKELQHRAEVAERALKDMCEEYEDNFECDLYKECNSDKPCYLCDYKVRLQNAAREIEEGKKDE